jgi:hypothetical protein
VHNRVHLGKRLEMFDGFSGNLEQRHLVQVPDSNGVRRRHMWQTQPHQRRNATHFGALGSTVLLFAALGSSSISSDLLQA